MICPECQRDFPPQSFNAKYCTLRCKNRAADKRRRDRERALAMGDAPIAKPAPDFDEINRMADEINAKRAGQPLQAPTPTASQLEDALKALGFSSERK